MGNIGYLQKPENGKQFFRARLLVKVLLVICIASAVAMAIILIKAQLN